MGRRSRSRTTPQEARAQRAQTRAAQRPSRARAADGLTPARRTLAVYLGVAMLVSVMTVLGIAILGGTGGPLIVLAYAMLGGGLSFRWAQQRLAGLEMTGEDRMMQTMAGGLLLISVLLAATSAVVLSVA